MKKILLSVIIIFLTGTVILSKDFLAEKFIVYYLRSRYGVNCEIRKLSWSFKGISFRGIRLSSSYLYAESERLDILYRGEGLDLKNWRVTGDTSLRIEDVPSFSDAGDGPLFLESVTIRNFSLEIAGRDKGKLNAEIKARLDLRKEGMSRVEDLKIKELNASYGGITLERAGIEKTGLDKYLLRIDNLGFGKNKTGDILMPFFIREPGIVISGTERGFFGGAARVKGTLLSEKEERTCLRIDFERCSFSRLIGLLAGEDVFLNGLFDGTVLLCPGKEQGLSAEGKLKSSGGGVFLIKKEAPLDFLRKRLDALSYKSLIDNFRDYNYNRGEIVIKTLEKVINVDMKFDSDSMGRRDISVNFYKIRGGNYEYR